jgi:hypothetical protein
LAAFPQLTGPRLHRELRDLGYPGSSTIPADLLREIRPREVSSFEVRFETQPGRQAQVDFAHFRTIFTDEPDVERISGCSHLGCSSYSSMGRPGPSCNASQGITFS